MQKMLYGLQTNAYIFLPEEYQILQGRLGGLPFERVLMIFLNYDYYGLQLRRKSIYGYFGPKWAVLTLVGAVGHNCHS